MSSNTKKLIIMVIVFLLLSCFLSMVCGLSSFGFSFLNRNSSSGSGKTFPLSGNYSGIEIESESGNIRFYESNGKSAKVVWSGNNAMRFSVNTAGRTLKVREKYKLPWFLRIGINPGKAEIGVYLPHADYKELDLESDTGNITVPAGFSFASAEIETDTGTVDFQANVNKTLKIHTDTGKITCSGSEPEKIEIHSDTGAVDVTDIRGTKDFKVNTDTGKISLTNVSCDRLSAESDTGSLTLANVVSSGKMDLETDTGSIHLDRCDAGKLEIESDTGSINAALLSDKIFTTKSETGKIDVPESAGSGECSIKTDTGSITIRIVK